MKKIIFKLKSMYQRLVNYVDWTYVMMIGIVLIGYVLIHDLIGETMLKHNIWDSYTLQTKRWLEGYLDLGQNYTYLELPQYKGKFYVSFPPFPSVLMIPWVIIFGVDTPNNLIMVIYIIIALSICYKITRLYNVRPVFCAFWSVVVVLGCNMLWMSTMAGVWFQAQLVNMILCFGAIYCMLTDRRMISYICIALAVGCRPFSIVYFIVLFVYYYYNDYKMFKKQETNKWHFIEYIKIALNQFSEIIISATIGMVYMIYNYVRFNSLFEFGHNYLVEFIESKRGQFNVGYIMRNLYRTFIRGVKIKENLGIKFPLFDGFLMYVANPIFIILFICIIKCLYKRKIEPIKVAIIIAIVINILCLCMHKTLGGIQFGNRYMVDLIPFAYIYILMTKEQMGALNKLSRFEVFIGTMAIMFNAYGIAYMYADGLKRLIK